MEIEAGDIVVGVMMALLGLLGLILGAGAADDAMYVFGLSLFAFACLFVLGQIRRHYDRADAARAQGESRHV